MYRAHRGVVALVAVALFTSGCYGPFYLTRKVYAFNGQVSQNKWIVEAAFLVMWWIPVYGVASALDGIIFNSIEFWTGNNPVKNAYEGQPKTKRIVRGDTESVLTHRSGVLGEQLTIAQFQQGRPTGNLVIEQRNGVTVGLNAAGEVLFTARTLPDGSVAISDAGGKQVASYSSDRVQRFAKSVSQ